MSDVAFIRKYYGVNRKGEKGEVISLNVSLFNCNTSIEIEEGEVEEFLDAYYEYHRENKW